MTVFCGERWQQVTADEAGAACNDGYVHDLKLSSV
jgi:hypothetical protein